MKSVKSSAFSFIILVGTSPFWEDLDLPKDLIFFKTSSRFIVSKLKVLFSWQKCFIAMIVFVLFQYKTYWIISNKWINPSRKVSVLIKRNFEVRKNVSEICIKNFCNFFFIVYDFILFNQSYFWRINRFVWKKRFDRLPESFISSYMFFLYTIIIFFLNLFLRVPSNFVVCYSFFCSLQFFFEELIPKSCSRHSCFRKFPIQKWRIL